MLEFVEGQNPTYGKLEKSDFEKPPFDILRCEDNCSHWTTSGITNGLGLLLAEFRSLAITHARTLLLRQGYFSVTFNKDEQAVPVCMLSKLLVPLGWIVHATLDGTYITPWGNGPLYLPTIDQYNTYAGAHGVVETPWPASFAGYISLIPPVDYDKQITEDDFLSRDLADVELE